jgi:hypothetical protein
LAFLLDVSASLLVLAHFKTGSQMAEPIDPSLAASGPPLATSCWSTTGAGLHGACDWQQNSKNKAPSANTLTMVPAWLWFMALGATPERLVAWPKAAGASKQCEFMTVYVHETKTIVSFEYM